jgi:putative hydrolase of the HAD superfamily
MTATGSSVPSTETPTTWDAVIFDYGGVLCYAPTPGDLSEFARRSGMANDTFFRLYAITRDYYGRSATGYPERWQQAAAASGVEVSEDSVKRFIEMESGLWTRPNLATLALARDAKAHGKKLAILSNMTFDLLEILKWKFDWLAEFDVRVWSCEHACAKPDQAIYRACLEALDCEPGRSLFFDDRQRNIDGATRAGMDAHLFESAEQAWAVMERGA